MITEWLSFVFSYHDHTVAFLMLMFCEIIYAQWECTQANLGEPDQLPMKSRDSCSESLSNPSWLLH